MRSSQALIALASLVGCAIGCVDPKGDYEDYVKATEKYRSSGGSDAALDTSAPTTVVKGTYYLSCLPNLAFGDINKLFRFYVESEYTPMGAGGSLTLRLTPMRIRDDAGNLLPAAGLTLKKEASGTLSVTSVPVAMSGKFTANFMTAMVAATSNPISFRLIEVHDTTVVGVFQSAPDGGPGSYCGGLSGQVVAPIMQDLGMPADNVCLFQPLAEGSPLPMNDKSLYVCPGI